MKDIGTTPKSQQGSSVYIGAGSRWLCPSIFFNSNGILPKQIGGFMKRLLIVAMAAFFLIGMVGGAVAVGTGKKVEFDEKTTGEGYFRWEISC